MPPFTVSFSSWTSVPRWMVSSPACPSAVSAPVPGSSTSLPSPPSSVSSPSAPVSRSWPMLPCTVSAPSPARSLSSPDPPWMLSGPSPPEMLSLPVWPLTVMGSVTGVSSPTPKLSLPPPSATVTPLLPTRSQSTSLEFAPARQPGPGSTSQPKDTGLVDPPLEARGAELEVEADLVARAVPGDREAGSGRRRAERRLRRRGHPQRPSCDRCCRQGHRRAPHVVLVSWSLSTCLGRAPGCRASFSDQCRRP